MPTEHQEVFNNNSLRNIQPIPKDLYKLPHNAFKVYLMIICLHKGFVSGRRLSKAGKFSRSTADLAFQTLKQKRLLQTERKHCKKTHYVPRHKIPFIFIPWHLFKLLTGSELKVFLSLYQAHENLEEYSVTRAVEETHISRRSVFVILKKLKDLKMLRSDSLKGNLKLYTVYSEPYEEDEIPL